MRPTSLVLQSVIIWEILFFVIPLIDKDIHVREKNLWLLLALIWIAAHYRTNFLVRPVSLKPGTFVAYLSEFSPNSLPVISLLLTPDALLVDDNMGKR